MNFKEELQKGRKIKIAEHALDFAENIQPTLKESAQNGFTGYQIPFEGRDDTHILKDPEFLKNIELLLDGCKAEVQRVGHQNIITGNKYYKSKLVITWS
ncbi:MAG TPA: hypothetical protein K8V56_13655 [Sporosarcina psychrophila]|uniref:Uncharacterized protein n=1 Tax=Sporosarcina psychrophila TaxID=1476 RepID=A0A921KE49_SPOPS|nr:hypothetical protein [Sporosarcina psychrophila]